MNINSWLECYLSGTKENFKLQFPFLKIMKIQKFPLNVVFTKQYRYGVH